VSALPVLLGLAWGVLAGVPLARRAARTAGRARAGALGTRAASRRGRGLRLAVPRSIGRVVGGLHARRRARAHDEAVALELPVVVDLLGVAVGAGCTPYLAVGVAAEWGPPLLAERLTGVRRACDLGAGFAPALDELATDVGRLRPLCDALLASDRYGSPVAPALARLAGEERASLRRRAEARARTVPVRLLFPLVFLVLPAFALLTVIPALLAGLART
jgi:pilus assembly protein TadC